jgi:hypothetical protein
LSRCIMRLAQGTGQHSGFIKPRVPQPAQSVGTRRSAPSSAPSATDADLAGRLAIMTSIRERAARSSNGRSGRLYIKNGANFVANPAASSPYFMLYARKNSLSGISGVPRIQKVRRALRNLRHVSAKCRLSGWKADKLLTSAKDRLAQTHHWRHRPNDHAQCRCPEERMRLTVSTCEWVLCKGK